MVWQPVDPTGECIEQNLAGSSFEEITCLYPWLKPTYITYELYKPEYVRDWMVQNPVVPVVACAMYGLLIVVGQNYFRHRPPWNWRKPMAAWNLLLSTFSAIGFCRVLPQFLHIVWNYSLHDNFCNDPESHYASGTTGFWVQLFVLSKLPELLDTWFIVIHKKPLIFLHWYHHVSVLLYCWHSYVTKSPSGIIFCVMNFGVHAVMYFYYFLMAVSKTKIKWAMLITSLQIAQMIVGVTVTLLGFYVSNISNVHSNTECWLSRENNAAALIMYGSYLALFMEFFIARYFGWKSRIVVTSKVVEKASSHNGVSNDSNGNRSVTSNGTQKHRMTSTKPKAIQNGNTLSEYQTKEYRNGKSNGESQQNGSSQFFNIQCVGKMSLKNGEKDVTKPSRAGNTTRSCQRGSSCSSHSRISKLD